MRRKVEGAPAPKQANVSADVLLRRLHWTVLRPLAAALGGDERSLIRGFGAEMTEVREYQVGDDVRHIDWNITARTDRPFVRESYVDRALDVWLMLDLSASVDWGTAECLKRDRAIEFAAVVGQLLGTHSNRVGALLFANSPLTFVAPSAGRAHMLRILAAMQAEPPQGNTGATDLQSALIQANAVIRRKSLVLIVSDFLTPDGWQAALGQLAQRHEIIAVRLHDPRESELPDVGFITLEDPETGAQLMVNTSDRSLRERFQSAACAQDEGIRTALARHGIDQLTLSTSGGLLPALVEFLELRRRRPVLARAVGA